MTDRLSLTNALVDAKIDRQNAERVATIIVRGDPQQRGRRARLRTARAAHRACF
jgi:hypothetical protein